MAPVDKDLEVARNYFPAPDTVAVTQPGQRLLRSLTAERARTGKKGTALFKADTRKLKEALPHHPAPSDVSIYNHPPHEVHPLPTYVTPSTTGDPALPGKREMEQYRAARHSVAWNAFQERRVLADSELEAAVRRAVTHCRHALAAAEEDMTRDTSTLAEEDQLMLLDEPGIYALWDAVAARLEQRGHVVKGTRAALVHAADTRRVLVEQALTQALVDLLATAHVTPGVAERLVEAEALALNLSLLQHAKEFAALGQRLEAAEVAQHEKRRS